VKTRIQSTFFVFLILFGLVATKAFYVQVVQKDKLLAYARSQFMRETREYPNRGSITDRDGNPLAINVQTWNLYTFPRKKGLGYQNQIKELSKIIPEMSYTSLWSKVKNRSKYTWLARRVRLDDSQVKKIKKLDAIHLEEHSTRVYPNHELSAQILGFTGIDNVGMAGIEIIKNKDLRGEAQLVRYHRDAKGRPVKYEQIETTAAPAQDIVLSVDKELQAVTERYLKEAVLHHKALRGGAGVMDVETGEVLAMANWPSFDPNEIQQYPVENRKLAFVTDPFEPGSIFKTLTIAAALENNVATPNKRYFCEFGKMRVQNHTISEAENDRKHKFEWLTVSEILEYSSNVGTTKIAFDMKFPKLQSTLRKLGVGEKTGIEYAGESKGIMTREAKVKPLTLSNISFGHGVATTGIQMLRAYAAFANGGYLINPTFIKSEESQITPENRVISQKTSEQMTAMLYKAVEDGTGTSAKIPHYAIAGKTGTAQRVSPRGGYDGYIASFAGFPVNVNKRFVILVYVDNPKANGYYGGVAAAPVFKKIAQYLLYKMKDFSKFAHYSPESNEKNLDSVTIAQSSSSRRNTAPGRMPNFIGMDKASAIELAENLRLQIELTGFGIVTKQSPAAGEPIAEAKEIRLQFHPPSYEE
jgi:cell division protein FtsI (penicillin-binding protein 3)